jgi:hypothetical protein
MQLASVELCPTILEGNGSGKRMANLLLRPPSSSIRQFSNCARRKVPAVATCGAVTCGDGFGIVGYGYWGQARVSRSDEVYGNCSCQGLTDTCGRRRHPHSAEAISQRSSGQSARLGPHQSHRRHAPPISQHAARNPPSDRRPTQLLPRVFSSGWRIPATEWHIRGQGSGGGPLPAIPEWWSRSAGRRPLSLV